MNSIRSAASWSIGKRVRPPASSTVRALKAPKKAAQLDPSGYDAGKKINGKKRHILVDTEGSLLHAVVHPADVQERDGGILLLATLFGLYPFLKKLSADGGYQGPKFRTELARVLPGLAVEIVKRLDTAQGFKVLPRRGRQTKLRLANRCRRLAKDFENQTRRSAFLRLASIRLMLRKLSNFNGQFPDKEPREKRSATKRRIRVSAVQ